MGVPLRIRLRDEGCQVDENRVRSVVTGLMAELHPDWSHEELMHHPTSAIDFCNRVRSHDGFNMLSDYLILRTLSGTDKNIREATNPEEV